MASYNFDFCATTEKAAKIRTTVFACRNRTKKRKLRQELSIFEEEAFRTKMVVQLQSLRDTSRGLRRLTRERLQRFLIVKKALLPEY